MNDFDPKKKTTFISYPDMNNLYGWAMSEYLRYGRFKWLKTVDEFDVISINEKRPIGYFLEFDYNYYSLAPEKIAVSNNMLSKYCKEIADKYEIKVVDVKKLIPNLGNKTNYVVPCRSLQLHLSLGMRLTKIYGVLEFKQSDWMKKYIDFNTEKRMNATNDF